MSSRSCPDWPRLMEIAPELQFKHYTVAARLIAKLRRRRLDRRGPHPSPTIDLPSRVLNPALDRLSQ